MTRCTATSKTRGARCLKAAIRGGTVCYVHGGGAPQVQRSARDRLDALVEPAIEALRSAFDSGDRDATIRAAKLVLDRCGFGPTRTVTLTSPEGDTLVARGDFRRFANAVLTAIATRITDVDLRVAIAADVRAIVLAETATAIPATLIEATAPDDDDGGSTTNNQTED